MNPTKELYQSFSEAYEHFNMSLFENVLPKVIFTVQRQKGVLGYFAPERWSSLEGKHCHEISINPTHLGQSRVFDVLQTLVHEMVHCWQYCFGSPGSGNYHNQEWASKMIEIGLQPTSTGLPGGSVIGQQMSDYPIEGGLFIDSCQYLLNKESFNLPWIDRLSVPKTLIQENSAQTTEEFLITHHVDIDEEKTATNNFEEQESQSIAQLMQMTYSDLLPEETFYPAHQRNRSKNKYQCPSCGIRVWGKPEMFLICGECDQTFEEID